MKKFGNQEYCAFCGLPAGNKKNDFRKLIGSSITPVYICNECVDLCSSIVEDDYDEENERESVLVEKVPSPKEIKAFLDEYQVKKSSEDTCRISLVVDADGLNLMSENEVIDEMIFDNVPKDENSIIYKRFN